jgi:hypothetical protein
MGTRGSVGFIANEKNYLTYNHFDSYPDGLGVDVIEFIIKTNDWDDIKKNVIKLQKVNETDKCPDDLIPMYEQFHQHVSSGDDWYSYLRDLQGIEWIYHLDEIEHMCFMEGDIESIVKDCFIEYTYIINLDDMTFNFWSHGNKEPDVKIPLQYVDKITTEDLDDFENSETLQNLIVDIRKEKLENLK